MSSSLGAVFDLLPGLAAKVAVILSSYFFANLASLSSLGGASLLVPCMVVGVDGGVGRSVRVGVKHATGGGVELVALLYVCPRSACVNSAGPKLDLAGLNVS